MAGTLSTRSRHQRPDNPHFPHKRAGLMKPGEGTSPPPDRVRHESDREDIMREATALRRRVSLLVPDIPQPVVAGFRDNGSLSLFVDQDPVYQFDPAGGLRRAYRRGLLYRTQGNTLAELNRVREPERTVLQRHDLTEHQLADFLAEMQATLQSLLAAISESRVELAQLIGGGSVLDDVVSAIARILRQNCPLAPAIPTRRGSSPGGRQHPGSKNRA